MGVKLNDDDFSFIFKHFDTDESGSLEYAEFENDLNADLKAGAVAMDVEGHNTIELRSVEDAEVRTATE